MIKPHKYLDLNLSVINQSALIIQELKRNRLMKYDELSNFMMLKLGASSKELYTSALSFLYLMNKINYIEELDAFELNETK